MLCQPDYSGTRSRPVISNNIIEGNDVRGTSDAARQRGGGVASSSCEEIHVIHNVIRSNHPIESAV